VYKGEVPFNVRTEMLDELPRPQTQVMLILGNPEQAFQLSFLPCDGVGLARMEFIVNEYIKVHPMALVHPEVVKDDKVRAQLQKLTAQYVSLERYFIQRLAEGVGTIAAAFYPRPVIVRMSDFKTNEYANLIGGKFFEPEEENPMLGFRGAARYTHPQYAEAFALECEAMKHVRNKMGLTNVKLMVPFCRTVNEASAVIERMAELGLRRGDNGLQIYMMCEIPNNVLQIDAFARLFDGISIGSNDLTQLVLGIDRDSDIIAHKFNELDPGVLSMIRMAVEGAKRNGLQTGLCGQAPSDYPEMAEYLVGIQIDSISLSPDRFLSTLIQIAKYEKQLNDKRGISSARSLQ